MGNVAPSPLGEPVLADVVSTPGVTLAQPNRTIVRNDESLVAPNPAAMTAHFVVKVVSNRRSRKNGVKMRKEIDIERECAAWWKSFA
jgi:hypothetical protein